jgi:glutamate synthase (ferredoxin)
VLYTNSNRGAEILNDWTNSLGKFVKVMPADYKKALKRLEKEKLLQELTA